MCRQFTNVACNVSLNISLKIRSNGGMLVMLANLHYLYYQMTVNYLHFVGKYLQCSTDDPVAAPEWAAGQTNCARYTRTTERKHTAARSPTLVPWPKSWHPNQNRRTRNEKPPLSHRKLYQTYLKFCMEMSRRYNAIGRNKKFHRGYRRIFDHTCTAGTRSRPSWWTREHSYVSSPETQRFTRR